jgi:hypothetical protein
MFASFGDLPNTLFQADGILVHAETLNDLYQGIQAFHARVRRDGWRLKASKTVFASQDVVFHGIRLQAKDGRTMIAPYARSRDAFARLPPPKNAHDLWKLLGHSAYNHRHIPDAARRFKPLQDLLNSKLEGTERNTKAAKAAAITTEEWTPQLNDLYKDLLEANNRLIMTAILDPTQAIVIYADANPVGWGAVLANVPHSELSLPHAERNTSILACTGGTFSPAQSRMFVAEQELLATRLALHRFRWAVQPRQGIVVYVYSDSEIVVQMLKVDSDWTRSRSSRLQRHIMNWQVELINFGITFEHVDGAETNWLADALSRARIEYHEPELDEPRDSQGEPLDFMAGNLNDLKGHNVEPREGDWIAPTIGRVREIGGPDGKQDADLLTLAEKNGATFDRERRVWVTRDKQVLIPADEKLRTSLIAIAHNMIGGHSGIDVTLANLDDYVYWPSMRDDITTFVKDCIHCMATSPLLQHQHGETIAATAPNDVVCADFLYMGPSPSGTHLLVLSDKFSAFSTYYFGDSENSDLVVGSLLHYFSMFGLPKALNLDRGPGFAALITKELSRRVGANLHLVSAGSHWANGPQERRVGMLRHIFDTLLSELQYPTHRWDELAPVVFMAFNNKPSPVRAGYAPITIMTGIERVNPLDFIFDASTKKFVKVNLTTPEIEAYMNGFLTSITERKLVVETHYQRVSDARRARQHKGKHVSDYKPAIGDYVMVADHTASPFQYQGPAQVIALPAADHGFVATVRFLAPRTSATKDIHVRDLRLFDQSDLVVSPALVRQAQHYAAQRFDIREILDYKAGHFQIEWDVEPLEITWEPCETIYTDVPQLVEDYIKTAPARRATAVRKALKL